MSEFQVIIGTRHSYDGAVEILMRVEAPVERSAGDTVVQWRGCEAHIRIDRLRAAIT